MGCYPTPRNYARRFSPAGTTAPRSWTAQEAQLGLQALDLPDKGAEQRQRSPVDPVVPAIMLDAAHLIERIVVKGWFARHCGKPGAEQAEPAVIPEHLRVHAGKTCGGIEQMHRGSRLDNANS